MRFDIITIFPKIFSAKGGSQPKADQPLAGAKISGGDSYLFYFSESILARAQAKKLIDINIHDLRDYATGKHRQVDDRPFGGGPGMVLKIEPIWRCVQFLKSKVKSQKSKVQAKSKNLRVILLSAKGKTFTQNDAKRLSKYKQIIFICGRYEGVDERVAKYVADEEISIGDYVLTGGELPAMIVIDTVSRLIPGVIGKYESLTEESFTMYNKDTKKRFTEYPHYTRPEMFAPDKKTIWRTPKVLISGNHKKIQAWRNKNAKAIKIEK